MPGKEPRRQRERGTVTNWVTVDYGFVKREGRSSDDIQLHVNNAKGEAFKKYLRQHGLAPGVRVKFVVDFEENRGRPYAAEWEMCDPPKFDMSPSRSRSGGRRRSRSRSRRGGKARRSPSYNGTKKSKRGRSSPSPPRKRASPSPARKRRSRSPQRKRGSPSPQQKRGSPSRKRDASGSGKKSRSPRKSRSARKSPSQSRRRAKSRSRSRSRS
mmetsp:Transcript_114916/g.324790  ORF Transcript_114916/g.324790 Transcript_114916/m.324790 type:complete len:213 (+) Transcript_114916:97-735(+)